MSSDRLKEVILAELDLEDREIAHGTTANMIPGWASLSRALIAAGVEAEQAVRFTTTETIRLKRVRDLQVLVDRKMDKCHEQ